MEFKLATEPETIPPDDIAPTTSDDTKDFDPSYPGSTAEAPYGYKEDGTPYKRRPKGSSGSVKLSTSGGSRNENLAASAADLLVTMNTFLFLGINLAGMPKTATQLSEANARFREVAYTALLNDAALCRKIVSAGGASSNAVLLMAYGQLIISAVPIALQERRELKNNDDNG